MTSLYPKVLLRRLAAPGCLLPILLVLLGPVLPAAAQTPDPPRFVLESVVVEGVEHDSVREIAAAESLLEPGREYTEQELREAIYRVKRLPFVLDAELALQPGTREGTYQLVIFVRETRLFFYSAEIGGVYDGDARRFPGDDDRINWGGAAKAGGRWFVGPQGVVSGSLQAFDSVGLVSGRAGYTHYNLFGRGGFVSASLVTDLQEDRGEQYQWSLALGLPIVGNHSLRAELIWLTAKDEFGSQISRDEDRGLGLSWIYDTTDDPLFPTLGTRLTVDARYTELDREVRGPFFSSDQSADSYDLTASGRRHWALTRRQSVSAELLASYGETEADETPDFSEQWTTRAALGYSVDLWGAENTERIGDLRWESRLEITRSEIETSYITGSTTNARLSTGPVFRNAWGLVRFSFTYVENLEEDYRALGGIP